MYVSPNHPRHAELTAPRDDAPPESNGEVLAALDRGREGVLYVVLKEFEGRPFLELRLWEPGRGGGLWPTKKGVSIRVRELPRVVKVLREAEGRLLRDAAERAEGPATATWPAGGDPAPPWPAPGQAAKADGPPWSEGTGKGGGAFSEF